MAPASASIALLVEPRYLGHGQPRGLMAALERRGWPTRTIAPDGAAMRLEQDGWLSDIDVVVARGRSIAVLCMLAAAEARGIPTVNRRDATAAVHNKAEMAVRLAQAGIPTPATYLGRGPELASRVPASSYPLVLKPIFGDNGRGLRVVDAAEELTAIPGPEPVALAQPYLASNGVDLKLYGIRDQIWAVRKRSPLRSAVCANGDGEPIPATPTLAELGRRCGELFGLQLWGVDCIETPEGPLVIEVNEFPNYTAVPDADEHLADHVLEQAGGAAG